MTAVARRESGRLLTGWDRTAPSRARVVGPLPGEQLRALVADRPVAIAMPAGHRRLGSMLDDLDLRAGAAGGRVYLAGDSWLRSSACAAMYPGLPQWRAAASRLDPSGVFRSDLGQRWAPETSRATTSGRRHAG